MVMWLRLVGWCWLVVDFSVFSKLVGNVVSRRGSVSYYCKDVVGFFALIKVFGSNGRVRCFEVWRLRAPRVLNSHSNSWGVRFPSNSDFGYYGWSFGEKSNADSFFAGLNKGGL